MKTLGAYYRDFTVHFWISLKIKMKIINLMDLDGRPIQNLISTHHHQHKTQNRNRYIFYCSASIHFTELIDDKTFAFWNAAK